MGNPEEGREKCEQVERTGMNRQIFPVESGKYVLARMWAVCECNDGVLSHTQRSAGRPGGEGFNNMMSSKRAGYDSSAADEGGTKEF